MRFRAACNTPLVKSVQITRLVGGVDFPKPVLMETEKVLPLQHATFMSTLLARKINAVGTIAVRNVLRIHNAGGATMMMPQRLSVLSKLLIIKDALLMIISIRELETMTVIIHMMMGSSI